MQVHLTLDSETDAIHLYKTAERKLAPSLTFLMAHLHRAGIEISVKQSKKLRSQLFKVSITTDTNNLAMVHFREGSTYKYRSFELMDLFPYN